MTSNINAITIRRVKNSDAPEVMKLIKDILHSEFGHHALVYPQIDLYDLEAAYGGSRDCFWVAEKEGKIVGTTAVKEEDDEVALLRRVFVDTAQRRKGYGLALIDQAIEFCKKHKYSRINFQGTSRMNVALRLCQKKGFKETDRIPMEDFELIRCSRRLP
jgi:N-acetylglutamate synthase-like GNAT family acetyltransferase